VSIWAVSKPLLDEVTSFSKISHIQRTYNWEAIFPDIVGVAVSGILVSKYCQSIRFGPYNISEVVELKTGPRKMFYPGNLNIESAAATFVTPVPDMVSFYFNKWKKLMVDDEGYYNPSDIYKKNIYIFLQDRTGTPFSLMILKGCFPVKFPSYSLDYSREEAVKFDVEFKVDRVVRGFKAVGMVKDAALKGIADIPDKVLSIPEKIAGGLRNLGNVLF